MRHPDRGVQSGDSREVRAGDPTGESRKSIVIEAVQVDEVTKGRGVLMRRDEDLGQLLGNTI